MCRHHFILDRESCIRSPSHNCGAIGCKGRGVVISSVAHVPMNKPTLLLMQAALIKLGGSFFKKTWKSKGTLWEGGVQGPAERERDKEVTIIQIHSTHVWNPRGQNTKRKKKNVICLVSLCLDLKVNEAIAFSQISFDINLSLLTNSVLLLQCTVCCGC